MYAPTLFITFRNSLQCSQKTAMTTRPKTAHKFNFGLYANVGTDSFKARNAKSMNTKENSQWIKRKRKE